MATYSTTRDRVITADRIAEHVATYGAEPGSKIEAVKFVLYVILFTATLVTFAVLLHRWDEIGQDVAHCSAVLRSGASDAPEAVRCAAVIG
jgi:hypothetical protein